MWIARFLSTSAMLLKIHSSPIFKVLILCVIPCHSCPKNQPTQWYKAGVVSQGGGSGVTSSTADRIVYIHPNFFLSALYVPSRYARYSGFSILCLKAFIPLSRIETFIRVRGRLFSLLNSIISYLQIRRIWMILSARPYQNNWHQSYERGIIVSW